MSLHHAWSSSRLAFLILLRIYLLLLLLQLLLLRKCNLFNISKLPFYHRLFIWLYLSWFSCRTWLSSSFNLIRRPYSLHSFFAFFIILLYSWDLLCGKLCIRHWTTAHHIKVLCMQFWFDLCLTSLLFSFLDVSYCIIIVLVVWISKCLIPRVRWSFPTFKSSWLISL
jgi:hypothetical protein